MNLLLWLISFVLLRFVFYLLIVDKIIYQVPEHRHWESLHSAFKTEDIELPPFLSSPSVKKSPGAQAINSPNLLPLSQNSKYGFFVEMVDFAIHLFIYSLNIYKIALI